VLFATPDFGAGGVVILILVGIIVVVSAMSIVAFFRGIDLCLEKPTRRWLGIVLIGAGVALPLCTFCGPSLLFRLQHATPPIAEVPTGLIQEGMSPDEVRALLGPPHVVESYHSSQVKWLYWRDAIRLEWYSVWFGTDGKVTSAGGS
jgi:hypothetical protein